MISLKKILSINLLISICSSYSLAELTDYNTQCGYVTSNQLMEANKGLVEAEQGTLTEVPLDYNDPSLGTTKVYSYFAGGFDPSRPTYVLFTGGPGQNSHLQYSPKFSFYSNLGFNFLMFDQRGIAFSRMANAELAKDARFHSSESTARDVLTIINKLKIQKISVYGASYGTIPATIFASLFPEKTNALVLEGVVYDGWNGVMGGRNVTARVQKLYDSLSSELKARIDQLMTEKKISEFWFPMITRGFMMQYGEVMFPMFKEAMKIAFLDRKLETEADVGIVFAELAQKSATNENTSESSNRAYKWYSLMEHENKCTTIKDSNDLNSMLMLKEFGAGRPDVTALYTLTNGKIVPFASGNYADRLENFTNMSPTLYSADQYPVKVPVFYIQGTFDGATPAPGASLHYKKAAKGPAQLLFFKGSSHMPFGLAIFGMNRADENWQQLQSVFVDFLNGRPFSCENKKSLEKRYSYIDIALATKGFEEKIKCDSH